MNVLPANPSDAARIRALLEKLYTGTPFLLYTPGEMEATAEAYAKRLAEGLESQAWMMYLAEIDNEWVGVVFGGRGHVQRTSHCFMLGLGVLQAHWGKRIGETLLLTMEQWARSVGVHRFELTVHATNSRAMRLYERVGFEREGIKRHAQKIEGQYVDECIMAKLLGPSES